MKFWEVLAIAGILWTIYFRLVRIHDTLKEIQKELPQIVAGKGEGK